MVSSVKGTQDIRYPEIKRWQRVEATAREVFARYGFTEIRTPILERTELFVRGIGSETDIVNKEMYTFKDRKGRSLTLRPENTAGVARAVVEHSLHRSPSHARLFYIGPQFRYERPQKGRYRQFHQVGAEVIGDSSPGVDAETIAMVVDFLSQLGVMGLSVQVNSVGCPECRPGFVRVLKEALEEKKEFLCPDCNNRLERNPLRVFDCKVPSCREILKEAPVINENLCDDCRVHHEAVRKILGLMNVEAVQNPRLVRGLDYYTRTVFEITSAVLGAQDAIVGGGRYDGLLEEIGGPAVPAFGWALGIERLIMVLPDDASEEGRRLYLAWNGEDAYDAAVELACELRKRDCHVVMEHSARSFKSALKRADKLDSKWTVLLGEDELSSGLVTLKEMSTGEQSSLKWPELFSLMESEGEK